MPDRARLGADGLAPQAALLRSLIGAELSAFLELRLGSGAWAPSRPNRLVRLASSGMPAAGDPPARPLSTTDRQWAPSVVGRRWRSLAPDEAELFSEGLLTLNSDRHDEPAVNAMLDHAQRSGWQRVGACGQDAFCRRVRLLAPVFGLQLLTP